MEDWLAPIETGLSSKFDALRVAFDFSQEHLREARSHFKEEIALGTNLDIVVCGSLARQEMSGASDFDYLIVAHGLVDHATQLRTYRRHCIRWCEQREVKPPGATGLFGSVVSATDLVERIGLEHDTNASLTRRILLLQEGTSVLNLREHKRFLDVVIGRYLEGGQDPESDVPRFLLNDICRYWRTVAVDYQAKVWQRLESEDWGVRYLKLRITRKLTFVASITSLLLVQLSSPGDPRAFLVSEFGEKPPLARLGGLVPICADDEEALTDLRAIYTAADVFSERLADPEWRRAVEKLGSRETADDNREFRAMSEVSVSLELALERLFLNPTTELGRLGRKYLAF